MARKTVFTLSVLLFTFSLLQAQGLVPRKIIDSPTAGNIRRGQYHFDCKFFPEGGILGELVVGLTDNLYFGLAYGGSNLIGAGDITTNSGAGIVAQFRVIDENVLLPAVAVGYNNQEIGPYQLETSDTTYTVKAKGIYAVLSKNYLVFGNLGIHAGLNYRVDYRLEEKDSKPDLFFLLNKELNPELSLLAEYDAAINDDQIEWGYLNVGVSWTFGNQLQLEIDFKNILSNPRFLDVNRELRIVFMDSF